MKIIGGFLLFILSFASFVFAGDVITYSDYMKNLDVLRVYDGKLAKISLLAKLLSIKDHKCEYEKLGSNYILSPVCILRKEFPDVEYKELVDKVWYDIDGFDSIYNDSTKNFSYQSANPIFEGYRSFLARTDRQKYLLASLQEKGKKISVPSKYIYYEKAKDLGFFVVRKDLSILLPCTKKNYNVALNSLDNYIMSPGEILNLNKHISYLPGYCKGTGPQNLMFYGGVCGFASQLFRNSLLNPNIEITKRSGHSVWLTAYYSDYLYGDDAAIYQNNKQLEIKNNSDQEIYFKLMDKGNYNYFVSITPSKSDKKVVINKEQISNLSSKLIKEVFDIESGKKIEDQTFESVYSYKSDAVR